MTKQEDFEQLEEMAKTVGLSLLTAEQLKTYRKRDVREAITVGDVKRAVAPYLEQQQTHLLGLRCFEEQTTRLRRHRSLEVTAIRLELRVLKRAKNAAIREFSKTIAAIRRAYKDMK